MAALSDAEVAAARAALREGGHWHRQGLRPRAIALLRQGLAILPQEAEAWYELGYLLRDEGHFDEAVEAFGQALAQGVARPHEAHLHRAALLHDHLRRDEQARTELQAALALAPHYLQAWLNLGNLYEQQGAREQALACYTQVLDNPAIHDPQQPALRLVALARSAIIEPPRSLDDALLARLRDAAANCADDLGVRATLLFALGHALDGLQASDEAFDAYTRANRSLLRRDGRHYHRRQAAALTDALIEAFPAGAASAAANSADGAEPLFICGMFRSGSTLVEQVLAAHPQVRAGGEMDWLLRTAAQRLAPFPGSMRSIDSATLTRLAESYRAHVAELHPVDASIRYVSDKRPDNYQLIGFIKRLFPRARIIHTTRHPLDNGLSVYMQHMNLAVTPYANDLADIGHHYGEYRRLMAHWKAQYADSIHDFDYDAFIAAPEASLRQLLAFLELPFDAACLDFHQLRNTVKTASYWQVRQPLYARARGRWQRYRRHLQPLIDSLRQAGVDPRID